MHRIRLRKPWMRTIGPSADLTTKVDVPDPGPPHLKPGQTVTYKRSFNRPTGLDHTDQVWIDLDAISGQRASIQLNEHPLYDGTPQGPIQIEATDHLGPANRLTVTIVADDYGSAVLSGIVNLRISSPTVEHPDD